MSLMVQLQQKLKAPKDLRNDFGGFNYRSAESILLAAKPILAEHEAYLNMADEIVAVSDRIYVKATATVYHEDKVIGQSVAYAREPFAKKGMDDSQLTGAASSYARKYALNGLFGIDDAKDADTNEYRSDEIQDPTHRFKKGEKEEIIKQIRDAIFNGEVTHLAEVWHEQPKSAILKLWTEFTSEERSAIKKMLKEAE